MPLTDGWARLRRHDTVEMACVLLVTRDEAIGDAIGDRLEGQGHEVMWCPGPHAPSYLCSGGRGERCGLAATADVVVLDGWLASDEARRGAPSWHLLLYYRNQNVPVVALVGPDGLPGPLRDASVVALPRDTDPAEVVAAVRSLLVSPAGGLVVSSG